MFQSLQAGRAVAALMVLGFHLGLAIEHYFGIGSFRLPFGHAGVEFFFVLSGFIITAAHFDDIHRPSRVWGFLWKRFVRVYPIYWVVFLAAYVGAYRVVALAPIDLLRALALVPADVAPVITVAWSLQWEVVFYLVFAAFIIHPLLGVAGLVLAQLCLAGSTVYLALFLSGVLCALVDRRRPRLSGPGLVLAGMLLFFGACAYDALSGDKPSLWLGMGASVLVLGLTTAERSGIVYGRNRALQALGDASYAIYLVHYPVISAGCKLLRFMGLQGPGWGVVSYALLLAAALGVGLGLHRWVERPLIACLNRRFAPSASRTGRA